MFKAAKWYLCSLRFCCELKDSWALLGFTVSDSRLNIFLSKAHKVPHGFTKYCRVGDMG